MANYIDKLKNKMKIKKLNSDQPFRIWIFVILLNFVGIAGFFYLKINNIQIGS